MNNKVLKGGLIMLAAALVILSLAGCDMLFDNGSSSSDDKEDTIPQAVVETAGGVFEYIGGVLQIYFHGPEMGYILEVVEADGHHKGGFDLEFDNFTPEEGKTMNTPEDAPIEIRVTGTDPFTVEMNGTFDDKQEADDNGETVTIHDITIEMIELTYEWPHDAPQGGTITVTYNHDDNLADDVFNFPHDYDDAKGFADGLRDNILGPPLRFYGLDVDKIDGYLDYTHVWYLKFPAEYRTHDGVGVTGQIAIFVDEGENYVRAEDSLGLQDHPDGIEEIVLEIEAWWNDEIHGEPDTVGGVFTVNGKAYDFAAILKAAQEAEKK